MDKYPNLEFQNKHCRYVAEVWIVVSCDKEYTQPFHVATAAFSRAVCGTQVPPRPYATAGLFAGKTYVFLAAMSRCVCGYFPGENFSGNCAKCIRLISERGAKKRGVGKSFATAVSVQ